MYKLGQKELRKTIKNFFFATYFLRCERCDMGGEIPAAEQLQKREELPLSGMEIY